MSAIEIQNFKSIKGPARLDIKPITLLFGPNSSGKSTVIQVFHYAYEVFVRRNLDPGTTVPGGDQLDLGGFRNLIHDRNLEAEMVLRFDLDLEGRELPYYDEDLLVRWETGNFEQDDAEPIGAIESVRTVWVEVTLQWGKLINAPIVSKYVVGLNDEFFVELSCSLDGKSPRLSRMNLTHEIYVGFYSNNEEMEEDFSAKGWNIFREHFEERTFITALLSIVKNSEFDPSNFKLNSYNTPVNIGMKKMDSALPRHGGYLIFDDGALAKNVDGMRSRFFISALNSLILGPLDRLRETLQEFTYLGPIRSIPDRNFIPSKSYNKERWATGLAAWDVLEKAEDDFLKEVNDWLSTPSKLNTGYILNRLCYKELNINGMLLHALLRGRALDDEWVADELAKLPVRQRMFLREITEGYEGIEVMPQDIGVGISQVLPVVVLALEQSSKHSLRAIEQPELHVHPALQVGLGDLLISQIFNGSIAKSFLIETHSEHLLLRVLRRIREQTNCELPEGAFGLAPVHLAIYFFEKHNGESHIVSIGVDREGEFLDPWPMGFFEERVKELF